MYLEHFNLTTDPFPLYPSLKFVFMSTAFEETMAHMAYGLEQNEDIVLITGPIGTGKTLAIHSLLSNLSKLYRTAFVNVTQVDFPELLKLILADLDAPVTGRADRADLVAALKKQVRDVQMAGGRVLVVIDEAQNLSPETLEGVRLLTNLGHPQGQALQVILSGQMDLERKVNLPQLAQLRQRIRVHYQLESLGRQEIDAYVAHRLKVAGCDRQLFRPKALDVIYQASAGVPRLVNLLAGRALLAAYVEGKGFVDAEHVDLSDMPPVTGTSRMEGHVPATTEPPSARAAEAAPKPQAGLPVAPAARAPGSGAPPGSGANRSAPAVPPLRAATGARAVRGAADEGAARARTGTGTREKRRPKLAYGLLGLLVVALVAVTIVALPKLRGGLKRGDAGSPAASPAVAGSRPTDVAAAATPSTAPRREGTAAASTPDVARTADSTAARAGAPGQAAAPAAGIVAEPRPLPPSAPIVAAGAPAASSTSSAAPAGARPSTIGAPPGSTVAGAKAPGDVTKPPATVTAPPTAQAPPPAAAAPDTTRAVVAAAGAGEFAVHVHSFRDPQRTATDLSHLRDSGYPCFYRNHVSDGVTWERVYVGPYRTLEEAQAVSHKLQTEGHFPYALVVRLADESS